MNIQMIMTGSKVVWRGKLLLLLLSCAKNHMLSAIRWQPHLLHVSTVDHRQILSMDKSWWWWRNWKRECPDKDLVGLCYEWHRKFRPVPKGRTAGFESDRSAREHRSRSFLYNGNVVHVFSVYRTPIVNCNFPWKSFGYKADSLASCVHACKQ